MNWARILAYVTGTVDQELPLRNEYLAAENRILKAQLKGRLRLSDAERATLGEIAHRLGRKVLGEAESSGKGQYFAVPSGYGYSSRGAGSMPRETGWALTLLPSRGRVNWRGRLR